MKEKYIYIKDTSLSLDGKRVIRRKGDFIKEEISELENLLSINAIKVYIKPVEKKVEKSIKSETKKYSKKEDK